MRASDEDTALVAGVEDGDPGAEAEFARRFKPRFELIARNSGVPAKDCEDVAQESLASAFSQIKRKMFRRESSLGTWLEKIIRGKIIDYRRSPQNRLAQGRFTVLDGSPETVGGAEVIVSGPVPDYVLSLTVREVLKQMPARERIILLLNRLEGLTIDEISERLGWPSGTVGRILAEAKREFRRILSASEEIPRRRRLEGTGEDG